MNWRVHGSVFSRNIYAAAVWYYHHCQKKMPIVMVTHEHAVFEYENKAEGVLVMNFKVCILT